MFFRRVVARAAPLKTNRGDRSLFCIDIVVDPSVKIGFPLASWILFFLLFLPCSSLFSPLFFMLFVEESYRRSIVA